MKWKSLSPKTKHQPNQAIPSLFIHCAARSPHFGPCKQQAQPASPTQSRGPALPRQPGLPLPPPFGPPRQRLGLTGPARARPRPYHHGSAARPSNPRAHAPWLPAPPSLALPAQHTQARDPTRLTYPAPRCAPRVSARARTSRMDGAPGNPSRAC